MHDVEAGKIKIVVGLGNPGRQYERTRHNIGFMVLDALVQRWVLGAGRKAFGGLTYDTAVPNPAGLELPAQRVTLLKPHTYMNCSGQAVKAVATFYKTDCSDVLIVMDDLALPPGRIRIRPDGSAGGHKGLKDVQAVLGTDQIPRLRIGIGPTPENMDAADFVLKRFAKDEVESINRAIDLAVTAVEDWLFRPIAEVMDKYNGIDLEEKVEDDPEQ